jgi:hypothetical protein
MRRWSSQLAETISTSQIEVQQPGDVIAAFKFSKKTKIPLAIRNTGVSARKQDVLSIGTHSCQQHDYVGRASAPKSLGVSVKTLKKVIQKIRVDHSPLLTEWRLARIQRNLCRRRLLVNHDKSGCHHRGKARFLFRPPKRQSLMGVASHPPKKQAGVTWAEAYAFADANGAMIVGGSDGSVGATGGYLQGGGHSPLSATLGLAADRAVRTPNSLSNIPPHRSEQAIHSCSSRS